MNRTACTAILAFFAAIVAIPVLAQELDSRQMSLKIKNASDPNGVFQSAKSYLMKQKILVSGGKPAEFEAEMKFKEPDRVRSSYFYKGKLVSAIIMNADKVWRISGADNSISEITGDELARTNLLHKISSPKSMLCDIFGEIKIDKVRINDEELYQLFCRPRDERLPQITFFVGVGDFLQRRMFTTNEKGEPYSAEILKYSLADNVFVPAETRIMSGGIVQKLILEEFVLNAEIPDSEFEPLVPGGENTKTK